MLRARAGLSDCTEHCGYRSCNGRPQDCRISLPRAEETRGLLQLQREPQLPQLNKRQLFNITARTRNLALMWHVAGFISLLLAAKEDRSYLH